jgi:hypothetical protein
VAGQPVAFPPNSVTGATSGLDAGIASPVRRLRLVARPDYTAASGAVTLEFAHPPFAPSSATIRPSGTRSETP